MTLVYRLKPAKDCLLEPLCRVLEAALVAGAVAGSVLLLASRVRNHRRRLDSGAALKGRPGRLALLVAGLLAPYPANAVLFGANALLCALSAGLVLASAGGADPPPTGPVRWTVPTPGPCR